ncbi:hypothetical protein [Actinokineospora sp.]|uniref:hypothetical protein n=1 Tax=Actinokineospora sp. TaxID=1872133 RepID=UPI0040379C9F
MPEWTVTPGGTQRCHGWPGTLASVSREPDCPPEVATVDGAVPAIFAERPLLVVIGTVRPAEFVGRG